MTSYTDRYRRLAAQHAYERRIRAAGPVAAVAPYVVGRSELPAVEVREKVATQ